VESREYFTGFWVEECGTIITHLLLALRRRLFIFALFLNALK
jgi:hypothetical protein